MARSKVKIKNPKIIVLPIILFILFYLIFKMVTSSIVLKTKDKINIVFYGPKTVFYSIGFGDISYFFHIPANLEVEVPGGYSYYRVGALGKLISLEKKPDLLRKTFSAMSSSFLDLYFYPNKETIYYDENFTDSLPKLREIMFYKSNANFLDRLIISFYFFGKPVSDYKKINILSEKKQGREDLFNREDFFNIYQGYFYKKTYRNINQSVQILYTKNYKTAVLISNILEGEGMRVVDIDKISNIKYQISNINLSNINHCLIIEKSNKPTIIASDLQRFFNCQFRYGETEISDIIFILGDLEREWEVN